MLQRHMIINYPEYNNVISQLLCPKFAIADAFAGHTVKLCLLFVIGPVVKLLWRSKIKI